MFSKNIKNFQEIYKKDSDDLLNTVEIIWVNTHQPTHKSVQIPDDIRKKLEKFLINQNGEVVERFGSTTTPQMIETAIEKIL